IRAIAVDGATRVDIALAPEARVLGRVTTADGAAVPGALVIARGAPDAADRTDEPGTARAVADRDGRYELRGVGAGSIELRAAAPGWIATAAPAIELTAGARRTLALEVARPIAVTGALSAAGAPVARTRVRWRSRGGVEVSALTGADGRFALSAPPGPARIAVDGRTVITGGAIPDATAGAVAIELAPASQVRGRVVAGGKPVGGALIVARGPGYATATSDATGQFALALESPGRWQIGASSDELGAAARAVPITAERGRDRELGAIDLAWAGSIAGTVVDERGEPVVGAMVLAQNLDENDFGRSVTGPDGGFRCDKLSGGDGGYELRVVASDTSDVPLAFVSASPRIELGRGDRHITGVALTVVAPRATVRGTVVDVAGHPRADTAVRALGWASATASTDADGEFTLEIPGAGPFELIATARDGATARASNATTAAPVRITLAAAASLHVTATGFATPPAITLRRLGGSDFATGAAPLDAGGLAPGTYVVQASSGAISDVRTITVADGQAAEVALAARATAHVAGRVTIRPTGTGAAGLDCVAAPAIGGIAGFGDSGAVRTDAQGRFTLDVPAGDSELRCWRLDASTSDVSRLVHVEAGATAAIELSVIAAVDGASLGVSFEIAPEGARLTKVPRSLAMLQVGDLVTRAGGVELAGLSRTGLGFAVFTARATPTVWTVVRGGKALELTIPAR
ncbi:MAG: carboxypeptidase-like regulatory domain-containing protein, partial [Deltaproteobacteria bacterium]|nr:carboxypeptidase-like regulatory domain-containing protein [Deltaproteobacteria bacterium]